MIVTYLLLAVGFVLPMASIGASMIRDNENCRTEAELAAWAKLFAEERDSLLPEDFHQTWPQRQTPSDLPPRVGLVVAVDRPGPGRHRAAEPKDELTTTGQFWRIVEDFGALEQPCAHCATPEDGEPAHVGCPGCACPCGSAMPVVEEHDDEWVSA